MRKCASKHSETSRKMPHSELVEAPKDWIVEHEKMCKQAHGDIEEDATFRMEQSQKRGDN